MSTTTYAIAITSALLAMLGVGIRIGIWIGRSAGDDVPARARDIRRLHNARAVLPRAKTVRDFREDTTANLRRKGRS
jgi:hypothetical protein